MGLILTDSIKPIIILLDTDSIKQKRVIRIMNNASYLAHTDPLLFSNGILKVHDIYKLNVGLYMYDHDSPTQFIRSHEYYAMNIMP